MPSLPAKLQKVPSSSDFDEICSKGTAEELHWISDTHKHKPLSGIDIFNREVGNTLGIAVVPGNPYPLLVRFTKMFFAQFNMIKFSIQVVLDFSCVQIVKFS